MDTKRFWNDRLSAHWGKEGVGYLSLGLGFNHWMYAMRRIVFRRFLTPKEGMRALDIGAGTGFYTAELLQKGYVVHGVDISPRAIHELQTTFPQAQFTEGDVADGIAGAYDVIVAMDVLFHIMDDAKYQSALHNISQALSPKGQFIFSDNFPPERVAHRHQVSRSESEITRALQSAGLRIRERHPMFVLMNAPVKYRTRWWYILERVLWRVPFFGWGIGAVLYPLELLLVTLKSTTPSTELVICEKL